MSDLANGLLFILLAAFFQGTFAVFLKFINPWKWENFWFVYSIIALVVFPVVCSFLIVPNLVKVLITSPLDSVFFSFLFGMLWGLGSVLFGLSVTKIGLSLSYSLILGLVIIIGSLLPLFSAPLVSKVISTLLFGILFIFIGLAISTYAGIKRDGFKTGKGFKTGLIIAVVSGITSPMLNIGFIYGRPILETAKSSGASNASATLPIWIIVLFGGFLVNIGYAIYLLITNKTFDLFVSKVKTPLFVSVVSGTFWFSGFGIYGVATSHLGSLGTSAGWGLLMSLMIIISNIWGILTKEWKDNSKALKYQLISILVSILGVVIIAMSFAT